jgi:hypothetical protein
VKRRNRVIVAACMVGVAVLLADAAMFILHRRAVHAARPAPPVSLPKYVVLPVSSPPAARQAAVEPKPLATDQAARATPEPASQAPTGHRHTHHHHSHHAQ